MNFYNPYSLYPYVSTPVRQGLFSNLANGFRGINWGNILNNTQRTLNIINQAIPAVRQISPMVRNARTMFRVMNEFNRTDTPRSFSNNTSSQEIENTDMVENQVAQVNEGPTFFL